MAAVSAGSNARDTCAACYGVRSGPQLPAGRRFTSLKRKITPSITSTSPTLIVLLSKFPHCPMRGADPRPRRAIAVPRRTMPMTAKIKAVMALDVRGRLGGCLFMGNLHLLRNNAREPNHTWRSSTFSLLHSTVFSLSYHKIALLLTGWSQLHA